MVEVEAVEVDVRGEAYTRVQVEEEGLDMMMVEKGGEGRGEAEAGKRRSGCEINFLLFFFFFYFFQGRELVSRGLVPRVLTGARGQVVEADVGQSEHCAHETHYKKNERKERGK